MQLTTPHHACTTWEKRVNNMFFKYKMIRRKFILYLCKILTFVMSTFSHAGKEDDLEISEEVLVSVFALYVIP